jgi:NADPH2:quinone reductase
MAGAARAWFVDRYGGPERLILRPRVETPLPAGHVRVRTAAIGLNFADLFVRAGAYPRTPKTPFVPGMEISGMVESVAPGVEGLAPGTPAVVFLTAWYLCRRTEVAAGEHVVATAAAGGVGSALLQLLAHRGARALALVGSPEKREVCLRLGAEASDVYDRAEAVLDRDFGGRADVVADAIGGRIFRRLWRRLAPGGRYALYGFAAAAGPGGVARLAAARAFAAMGFVSPYSLVQSCRTLIGFNLSLLPDRTGELRRAADELLGLWRLGRIRPTVGARFRFEQLPEAHRALASRRTTGKVVVEVG